MRNGLVPFRIFLDGDAMIIKRASMPRKTALMACPSMAE